MNAAALRRRIVQLHARRARLAAAYGLWDGRRLLPHERRNLARMARAIKRLGEKVRGMGGN
jgi:hypothetical protein